MKQESSTIMCLLLSLALSSSAFHPLHVRACGSGNTHRADHGSIATERLVPMPTHPASMDSPWGLLYTVKGLTDYNNQCTPTLTEDNHVIVYTYSAVNGPGPVTRGIMMSTWNDTTGSWNPPVFTGLIGSRPFISPDGSRLYYHDQDDICGEDSLWGRLQDGADADTQRQARDHSRPLERDSFSELPQPLRTHPPH
jgi:hypothetical protein